MALEKGFWKRIDPAQLKGTEQVTHTAYKDAVDKKKPMDERVKARVAFIKALTPRLSKIGALPDDKVLTAMYNGRFTSIGFAEKRESGFFDLGNP